MIWRHPHLHNFHGVFMTPSLVSFLSIVAAIVLVVFVAWLVARL